MSGGTNSSVPSCKESGLQKRREQARCVEILSSAISRWIRARRQEAGQQRPEFDCEHDLHLDHFEIAAEFLAKRGDRRVGDSTGNDAGKRREVIVHVERKSVEGDPSLHRDADGGDLARADPDAGLPRLAGGGESEAAKSVDDHLFEEAQVGVEVFVRARLMIG